MKKVLLIAPYTYLPFYSGGQKLIARFAEHLGKYTDLTVIGTADNDTALAKNYTVLCWLKKSFLRYVDFSLTKKISLLIEEKKIDTLLCEHPYMAWLAFQIKKKTGVKVIIHTHNIEYQRFRTMGRWWWPLLRIYERWAFKKADHLFFITQEDKEFAISGWHIDPQKTIALPFGIEINSYPTDRESCRLRIAQKHGIDDDETILLFNGLLGYQPNLDALKIILTKINPLLLANASFKYKIIICGKGLPEKMNSLKEYASKNIINAGFVDDIESYFKAAAIFLNPVQSGGGIKTKMVEAIGYGTTVVATETGAAGVDKKLCANKLVIIQDNDWAGFANAVIANKNNPGTTMAGYYEFYYWGNIIKKIAAAI